MGLEFNEAIFGVDDRTDKSNNPSLLKGISIASKNCNSLNISSNKNFNIKTNKLSSKIIEILKTNCDVYLLQDLRLSSSSNHVILKKELECHKYGSYESHINSNKSNRGTAILFRRNLNYKVIRQFFSLCNNICIIDCILNNFRLSIISTYAPIQTGNFQFFPDLKKKIFEIGNKDFILMGDLNSTPCTTTVNLGNFDCFNMSALPNPVHCKNLNSWIESNFAYDLYRLINPSKIDFSYVPFGVGNINRSRIDHVFISPGLINSFNFCEYSEYKSSLFDHKTLIIKSNKIKKKLHSSIDPNLIDLPGLYDCVKFELIELFVNNFNLENSQVLLDCLPLISITSNEILSLKNSPFSNDLLLKQLILNKEEYLETLCSTFPTVEEMFEYECRIEHDLFLDVLLNCMKNCIISFQSNYKKNYNSHKLKLSIELSNLKASSISSNSILDKIFSIELELSKLENDENLRILENSKYFQIINNEKPSKMYCKLIKNNKCSDSLEHLLDENNLPFDDTIKRDNFIIKHFETKFSTPFLPTISLNDFFDNNSINDPLLNSHKLSNAQRLELDKEISLSELDYSLKTSNKASAPGPDGIPTSILSKFWKFLRIPMLRGFKAMIRKKKMTPLLRCSRIKLIPKSNYPNITSLGKARPIANVCSPYKILSGVISHRIETILETVIYKAQKAYSKTNIIAEPLLYTYELVSKAIETNTSLCVMNVDFSAAFDTISIKFLEDVLRFFNFGEFFIDMVITTLTERYGYVCTNEGQTKNFFYKSWMPTR
jgi:exonuclease III